MTTEDQNIQDNHDIDADKDSVIERISYITGHPSEQYSAGRSFDRLWERIQTQHRRDVKIGRLQQWKYVAAVASIALVVAIGYFYIIYPQQEVYVLNVESGRQQFTLPDGTHVWLNSGSRLTYTDAFGKEKRDVGLNGEAYFDVTKDSQKPFVVKTEKLNVKVLGTEFNVRAYVNDTIIATTLIEGSVHISSAGSGLRLRPGQQLLFNNVNEDMTVQEVDDVLYSAWKDGLILFRQTPVKDAFVMIERGFHTKIVLKNELIAGRKITGRFGLDDSPEIILKVMQETLPFSYRIENDSIYIE